MTGGGQVLPVRSSPPRSQVSPPHRQISLPDAYRLETAILKCVGRGDHCADCLRIANSAKGFREHPHLVRVGWNGVTRVNQTLVDRFVLTIKTFAKQLGSDDIQQHRELENIISSHFGSAP